MPDLVKFSDLKDSQPLTLNGDDLLAVAHKEQASSTGYSSMTTTPTQLSQYAVEEQTFVNLKTSSKTVENSINQTISNLADDYDNTATYDVDDCVLYEGNLYKCITAIPVAEEWDSTHWEQVKAVDVGSGGGGELPTYEKSANGSIVSFTDGGDNIPVKSLIVDITAVQAGEGTPSPSNIRAISGFDNVEIVRSGKNLWPFGDITSSENGIPFSLKAGTYNLSGTRSGTSTPSISIRFYYADGTSTVCQLTGTNSYSNSVTLTADVVKINKYISADSLVNVQLEKGSSKTTYEPYKGNTYTFNFGQTVYGGTLDVTKGILTVTHTLFDMGSVDWVKAGVSDYSIFYYAVSDKDDTFDFICSCFNAVEKTSSQLADLEMGTYNSTNEMNRLAVRYDAVSTSADFKTAVTGQYVVYKLATPIVIQLTPTEVRTLLGENNIFSNCGDVEVEYYTYNADVIVDLIKSVGTGGNDDKFQPVIYSDEEREIGVWVDGKPLYQKTTILTNITIAVSGGYSYDISSWNVDTVVKNPEGFITFSNDTDLLTVPFGILGNYAVDITSNRSAVQFHRTGGDITCDRVVFTLTYTKTTDQAGSGQWTPQGVPAHHYSEDEQVVGTWIDGSTLYEKTIDFGADVVVRYDAWTDMDISDTGYDKFISCSIINDGGTFYPLMVSIQNASIYCLACRSGSNVGGRYLTIQYTKSST